MAPFTLAMLQNKKDLLSTKTTDFCKTKKKNTETVCISQDSLLCENDTKKFVSTVFEEVRVVQNERLRKKFSITSDFLLAIS